MCSQPGATRKMRPLAATTGLLRVLSDKEVAGVMAHELAHVQNRDTLIMTITATIAGAISMLANFALFFGGSRNNPLGIVGTILIMILARWPPCWCSRQYPGRANTPPTGAAQRSAAILCGSPRHSRNCSAAPNISITRKPRKSGYGACVYRESIACTVDR